MHAAWGEQSLHDRIAFLRTLTLARPGRAAQSVAEMRQILVAILARDGRQAEQACIQHVEGEVRHDRSGWYVLTAAQVGIRLSVGLTARWQQP